MTSTETVKIFAVEDDPVYTKFIAYVLGLNPEFEVRYFDTGQACINALHELPDIITLDYTLPDVNGEEVLKQARAIDPNVHVIILSGQEDISTAVDLLKLGAYDYITKDEETKDRLLNSINNAQNSSILLKELNQLREEVSLKYDFSKSILGGSPVMKKVFSLMEKATQTNITVSISGETGTGKELVAKAIHYNSPSKKNKFVAVNIAAIPKDLLESELFGHEKGSFTGAITRRIGKFEEADDGTLFLDEIGEMDISMQAKLLRVLQEKEVVRIGGNDVIKINPRIVAATHRDLAEEVEKGNFREDLYYRLLGLPILLPPLRERGNDIILIANHMLAAFCKENSMPNITISADSKEKLMSYSYPGNVRELKSIMELAAVMSTDNSITPADITFKIIRQEESFSYEEFTMREYEFKVIQHFMKKYNNNVLKVAKVLDVGKSTIYRHLKAMKYE